MSKLKDSVDKRETAWHVSTVFRERQPVALPLSNFLRGVTWRRRGAADEVGTDQAGGRDQAGCRDQASSRDEASRPAAGTRRVTQMWGQHG